MGGLGRRTEVLERRQKERAVERVRHFWRSLSIEECALRCAWVKAEVGGLESPPDIRAVVDRERAEMDETLRTAIGWREDMSGEEISARIGRLLSEVDPFAGRNQAVRRRYEELMGGTTWGA